LLRYLPKTHSVCSKRQLTPQADLCKLQNILSKVIENKKELLKLLQHVKKSDKIAAHCKYRLSFCEVIRWVWLSPKTATLQAYKFHRLICHHKNVIVFRNVELFQ
jgi:hypothetical protein